MGTPAYVEGGLYAVERRHDGWHLAIWDGECFDVISDWQSGDRWVPEVLDRIALVAPDPFPQTRP